MFKFTASSLCAVFALSSSILIDGVKSQIDLVPSSSEYRCGNPNDADVILSQISNDTAAVAISSLRVGPSCDDHIRCDFLIPKEVHWHVYALPEGSTPKHSITPPGFIEPVLENGELRYELQDALEHSYFIGERVQAGVHLYLPIDQLSTIRILGVEQLVELSLDQAFLADRSSETLRIQEDGVENSVTARSPYMMVDYSSSGVDSKIFMDVAAGSTMRLAGVDLEAYVKSDGLEVYSSGVDAEIVVEGIVTNAVMNGVDGDMEINGSGCDKVALQGVDNKCDNTDDTVTVKSLSCTASTRVAHPQSWCLSTGASIGLGVGLFFLIFGTVTGIIFCCRRRRRCRAARSMQNAEAKVGDVNSDGTKETRPSIDDATVLEAEVLEVKPGHLTSISSSHDVETADETNTDAPYWKNYSK